MKTLDEIAIEHGTDKATVFTRTYAQPHGYTPIYEICFEPIRDRPIKFLEIGVGGGESIRTWLEYFPKATVYGVDLVHDTNYWNTPQPRVTDFEDRYRFVQGSQSCTTFWACFLADEGVDWNVIVDDGSHILSDMITTFNALWPHVLKGGLYCVEDLGPEHLAWINSTSKERTNAELDYCGGELAIFRKL